MLIFCEKEREDPQYFQFTGTNKKFDSQVCNLIIIEHGTNYVFIVL